MSGVWGEESQPDPSHSSRASDPSQLSLCRRSSESGLGGSLAEYLLCLLGRQPWSENARSDMKDRRIRNREIDRSKH